MYHHLKKLLKESLPEDKVQDAKQKSWKIENTPEQVTLFTAFNEDTNKIIEDLKK